MRLLILHHDDTNPHRIESHYIHALCYHWEQQGVEVIHRAGCRDLPSADLVLLHVDLSVVPERFRHALRSYPRVWNQHCTDIRKRQLPERELLLTSPSNYVGPVIVKTDLNCAAASERRLFRKLKWSTDLHELWRHFQAWRSSADRNYPIYPDAISVPPQVWNDPMRVVEKFLPEREGIAYVVRWAYFCGKRHMAFRSVSAHPVVRWSSEDIDDPIGIPQSIHTYRQQIGLDYGKIDYVEHEGRCLILDVNKTVGGPGYSERNARLARELAPGLLEGCID